MKLTRRGLFEWLGALAGALGLSRVAKAELEIVRTFTHVGHEPLVQVGDGPWRPMPNMRTYAGMPPDLDKSYSATIFASIEVRERPNLPAVCACQGCIGVPFYGGKCLRRS